jgi:hypothetical protein
MSDAHAAAAHHEESALSKIWKFAAVVVVGGAAIVAILFVIFGVYLPMIVDTLNSGVSGLMRLKVLSMLLVSLIIAIAAPPAILYFGIKWASK